MKKFFASLMLMLFAMLSTHGFAQQPVAQDPVKVELKQSKVVSLPEGKERLEKAERAKPGDTIEYVASYSNVSKATVPDVSATLPIPEGTRYVAKTAQPAKVMASLDGKKFEPVPLKRKVKRADGSEVEEEVPVTEYKSLRWQLGAILAGKNKVVSARVQLNPAGK